jgi:hypothetical protein
MNEASNIGSRARLKGMSSNAYRSTLTGVLTRVMVVVLLGCVGLTAGLAYGTLFSSNEIGATIVVPAESSYTFPSRYSSAPDVVRIMRGLHRGVRVVAHGDRVLELSANGSLSDAQKAAGLRPVSLRYAVNMVLLGVGRMPKVIWHGTAGRLPLGGYVLFGLLAGLSAALGFLVPPTSRATAVH